MSVLFLTKCRSCPNVHHGKTGDDTPLDADWEQHPETGEWTCCCCAVERLQRLTEVLR